MAKDPPQVWSFLEYAAIYTLYIIASFALSHSAPNSLLTLLFSNLPCIGMLLMSVSAEAVSKGRWRSWQEN